MHPACGSPTAQPIALHPRKIIKRNAIYSYDCMVEPSKIKEELKNIHKNSIEKISTLMISAFGLVAALAWNNAIQKLFTVIFGAQSDLAAMMLYAIFVTAIAVIATIYISRITPK